MPHIHDYIDYSVEVFIVYNQKVLIRLHDKYGIWTCPWWHVELDEDPNQWAVREAKEETWLDVVLYDKHQRYHLSSERQKELIPPVFMNMHHVKSEHYHVGMVYFASATTDAVVPLHESDASHQRKRMSKQELLTADDIEQHVKVYGSHAIDAYAEE